MATSTAFSAIVKIGAVSTYLKRRQVNFRILVYLLAGGLPGALLGALLLGRFQRGSSQGYVLMIVGGTVAVCASFSLWHQWRGAQPILVKYGLLSAFTFPIGLELGFSSVWAGALGSVLLLGLTTLAPAAAIGTDLAFGLVLSSAGASIHAAAGRCDWRVLTHMYLLNKAGEVRHRAKMG